MEKNNTKISSPRLLLNAEAFGFGPSAAMAGFFERLRPAFKTVAFMGGGHTIDLHNDLPYDHLYDITDLSPDSPVIEDILKDYDIFFTAMDSAMASRAKACGLRVFYYDALSWYWSDIPLAAKRADLYMGQNFFGVKDRLVENFHHAVLVPPIVERKNIIREKRDTIFINLGGLQNPFWSLDDTLDYARLIVQSIKHIMPANEKLVIASSQKIAQPLQDLGVVTLSWQEKEALLSRTKMAFMTPGLGNIYEAAAYNIPTAWLPPSNDSQGQQLDLLKQNHISDADLDWFQFLNQPIDYKKPQEKVLENIHSALTKTMLSPVCKNDLRDAIRTCFLHLSYMQSHAYSSQTANLLARFGSGGSHLIPDLVIQHAYHVNPYNQNKGPYYAYR